MVRKGTTALPKAETAPKINVRAAVLPARLRKMALLKVPQELRLTSIFRFCH